MKIARPNPLTGATVYMEIDVDPETLKAWENGDGLIQDLMPQLTADEREFIITGITSDSWSKLLGSDDSESA